MKGETKQIIVKFHDVHGIIINFRSFGKKAVGHVAAMAAVDLDIVVQNRVRRPGGIWFGS